MDAPMVSAEFYDKTGNAVACLQDETVISSAGTERRVHMSATMRYTAIPVDWLVAMVICDSTVGAVSTPVASGVTSVALEET